MPAAVYKGRRTVQVEEVPVPNVGPGQVLMEVSHCGICGSDLHMIMEDWGTPGSISGHEYSGVLVEIGEGTSGWSAGDRAIGGPSRGCGRCEWCRSGRTNLCANKPKFGIDPFVGAFARYKLIDADCLYRVPDGLELRSAALTEPLAVALRGVRRAGPSAGRPVLVTGGGPIGQLTVAVLIADGVTDITVSEPSEVRQDLVRRIGASRVIRPDELHSPPLPMDVADGAYAAAFECSGRPEAMEVALDNLDRAGMLVLSGTGMKRPRFDSNRIILNELVITGTVEYTPADYDAAIDLLASGRLPVDALVEAEDQPLDRVQWAMEQLSRGDLAGKVMVAP
jgi:2-desacetyl-2-hydroxyethyl bacteriochlorophyllide A dehydrogenase